MNQFANGRRYVQLPRPTSMLFARFDLCIQIALGLDQQLDDIQVSLTRCNHQKRFFAQTKDTQFRLGIDQHSNAARISL